MTNNQTIQPKREKKQKAKVTVLYFEMEGDAEDIADILEDIANSTLNHAYNRSDQDENSIDTD